MFRGAVCVLELALPTISMSLFQGERIRIITRAYTFYLHRIFTVIEAVLVDSFVA